MLGDDIANSSTAFTSAFQMEGIVKLRLELANLKQGENGEHCRL